MPSDPASGPRTSGCVLALLAAGDLGQQDYADHLSRREAAHLARLAPGRRRRWLAGRLGAKYLALRGPGGAARLVRLDGARLRAFDACAYRQVEVLPAADTGRPQLDWGGRRSSQRVSISHSGGVACAGLSGGEAPIGIDMETDVPRARAFYRGNFSARERRWAELGARRAGLDDGWLYTFLWTVKEAALKSGAAAARNVWELPRMEVVWPWARPERIAASRGSYMGERFAVLEVVICEDQRRTRARVETTSTPEVVLTAFEPFEASA